jgi:DNA-binding response OmpR family regulator
MPATAAPKVLIVDDDAHLRGLLARRFIQQGLEVTERPDGAEGLEAMNSNTFDCILLDLKMPKKDGMTVLQERVATRNKETPVFVLTSMPNDLATERAKELGADRVLNKSETSPTEVVEMVVHQARAE